MMDFHLLVIITCVSLASLLSLLFINKFFRRKTFEEIIAEKKALSDKIYAQNKLATKKPKKAQPTKKDLKREKKQRQREQQKDNTEQEDSDAQSEQPSVEEEPQGLSKTHVEFEPDPEVIVGATPEAVRRASIIAEKEKENLSAHSKQKTKKEKKSKSGILVNKNEPLMVRENLTIEEAVNTFETKQPKDIVELKKQEREKKDTNKKEKNVKKEKAVVPEKIVPVVEQPVEAAPHAHVAKEIKQQDEKVRHGSPKNTGNANSNNNNNNKGKQQSKKQIKESAATKELVLALDKLSENDTIGVSLLMNLFRRAELNRSEIQILIDYLLNKQQDMPTSHSEWSDDICQKLKRQLEEKERALIEEQKSSAGIQAKLRELRTEINTERAQLNATVKMYVDKIQAKEQESAALNQEIQALNEKFALERKQFQAKLLHEKQSGSQDLLAQLQLMQNELAHKDKCINDLTIMVNGSHQAVERLEEQVRSLEQQRDELEQASNNRIFELENAKTMETENAESKVEIRNLQNELESTKSDLAQVRKNLEETAVCSVLQMREKEKEFSLLQAKNEVLLNQLAGVKNKADEQSKEQTGLQGALDSLRTELANKETQLADFNAKNVVLLQQLTGFEATMQKNLQQQNDLQKLVEVLKADVDNKDKQLQEVEQAVEKVGCREKELLQQLQEQKEKNNDLRMKNWKLVEALQNAEKTTKENMFSNVDKANLGQQQQLIATMQKPSAPATATITTGSERSVREVFRRLYPDAVKMCASAELSMSIDQWVQIVLETQEKLAKLPVSSSNKSTQSISSNNGSSSVSTSTNTSTNNHNSVTHNSSNDNLLNCEETSNSNSRISNSANSNSEADADAAELRQENTQLRAKVEELTKLVTKTSNTLSDLEGQAREQHEKWERIILLKDEEISRLQHSNGAQDI